MLLPTDYPARGFILDGVKNGFSIVDVSSIVTPAEAPNHPSATNPNNKVKVEALIKEELRAGHYLVVDSKPMIISPLAAVPKANGTLRLIHDGSRPAGNSMNTFASSPPVSYQSLDDALSVLRPGMFMAKVDLKSAYRSVRIKDSDFIATGLQWTFEGQLSTSFMVDTRLPFGNRRSPHVFNTLTQAARHIIAGYGKFPLCRLIAYLDDFWLTADTAEECQRMLLTTIQILRRLGWMIAWEKVVGPTRQLTFLGVDICSSSMTVTLPHDKLRQFHGLLVAALSRRSMSKRQMQSLIGKLNWITRCVYGGRTFLRRLINFALPLRTPWHRKRLTREIFADLRWWLAALSFVEGRSMPIIDSRTCTAVYTDASHRGLGAVYESDSVFSPLAPTLAKSLPIAFIETLAVLPAAQRWASAWAGKRVFVYCDNTAAVNIINKGSCRSPLVLDALRQVWLLSVQHNFRLSARYLPGKLNAAADQVSRKGYAAPWAQRAGPGRQAKAIHEAGAGTSDATRLHISSACVSSLLRNDGPYCDSSAPAHHHALRDVIGGDHVSSESALSYGSCSPSARVEGPARPHVRPSHRLSASRHPAGTAAFDEQQIADHTDLAQEDQDGPALGHAARRDVLGYMPLSVLHSASPEQCAPPPRIKSRRETDSSRARESWQSVRAGDDRGIQDATEGMQTAHCAHPCQPMPLAVPCHSHATLLGPHQQPPRTTSGLLLQPYPAFPLRRFPGAFTPNPDSRWAKWPAVHCPQFSSRRCLPRLGARDGY